MQYLGFPGGSAGKESTCNVGDLSSIPGLGRSPGEGKGHPLQWVEPGEFCVCHVSLLYLPSNFQIHIAVFLTPITCCTLHPQNLFILQLEICTL